MNLFPEVKAAYTNCLIATMNRKVKSEMERTACFQKR